MISHCQPAILEITARCSSSNLSTRCVAFALKFTQRSDAMFYDKAVLSAHYAMGTEAHGLRMDAEAKEILAPYMPRGVS